MSHKTWPAEAIWEQVYPLLPNFTVEILPEIDSTNSELMRRARAGQHEPTLLVAERQTAGRGRMGRVWQSQPGDSLTFSLSLPFAPKDWSGLSLAVGLSLAESLHPQVGLKWPNDLWVQERKLGGILVEAASMGGRSQVVVGVGLNIRPRPVEGLNTPPTALAEWQPGISAPQALARVAACTPAMACTAHRWVSAPAVRYDCKPMRACWTCTAPKSVCDLSLPRTNHEDALVDGRFVAAQYAHAGVAVGRLCPLGLGAECTTRA